MSLLMDALKKAELAKRQGQNNPAPIRQEPELSAPPSTELSTLPTIALSLDPIDTPVTDSTPEAAEVAKTEATPPLSFPDLQLISAFDEEPEPEAAATPETAANKFEQLDAEFMAEVQQAAAARTVNSVNSRLPEASAAKIAASDAKADGAAASATSAEPLAGEHPHSLREMQQQMLRDVIARSTTGDVRSPVAAPRPEPPATPGSPNASMQQAQNLFAAKQATKPPSRKGFAIAVGGFAVVAAAAIVGYFWWQLQPKSSFGSVPRPPSAATPTPPLAVAPPPTPAPLPGKPWAAPAQAKSSPREVENAIERRREIEEPALTTPTARQDKPSASSESPIRIDRSPQKSNPALARGYDAFNRNDLTQAQSEYERALKTEPHNRDALHGLAAIAQRQGQTDRAQWLFQRILEADPHDPVALSAQLGQQAQSDPTQNESRLKTLAAKQPDSAAPQFSLGTLYARQGRWSEAQTAYFRAYTADPENPDIAYNLAISLEHLRQPKLARQYYQHAINAVQTRPASFDPAQAAALLRVLEAEGP
ncbi:MAG TPA: tetratricopeptide repeat protein [Rhodocyclaceae bacterium]|nr:tetratricopeptide repeat protein [Rhodocyclaceae bacterium]